VGTGADTINKLRKQLKELKEYSDTQDQAWHRYKDLYTKYCEKAEKLDEQLHQAKCEISRLRNCVISCPLCDGVLYNVDNAMVCCLCSQAGRPHHYSLTPINPHCDSQKKTEAWREWMKSWLEDGRDE
jgi:hypothetical protein